MVPARAKVPRHGSPRGRDVQLSTGAAGTRPRGSNGNNALNPGAQSLDPLGCDFRHGLARRGPWREQCLAMVDYCPPVRLIPLTGSGPCGRSAGQALPTAAHSKGESYPALNFRR